MVVRNWDRKEKKQEKQEKEKEKKREERKRKEILLWKVRKVKRRNQGKVESWKEKGTLKSKQRIPLLLVGLGCG